MTGSEPTGAPAHLPGAPPATAIRRAGWRTSSRSSSSNCVEVAALRAGEAVGVRDSKDRGGPVLVFAPTQWRAFLAGAKAGEFDRVDRRPVSDAGLAPDSAQASQPGRHVPRTGVH